MMDHKAMQELQLRWKFQGGFALIEIVPAPPLCKQPALTAFSDKVLCSKYRLLSFKVAVELVMRIAAAKHSFGKP